VASACLTSEQKGWAALLDSEAEFRCGMGDATCTAVKPLPHALQLAGAIGAAVSAVGTGAASTISEHLRSTVTFCDGAAARSTPPTTPCVDRTTVACGLAIYRRALVNGWVDGALAEAQLPEAQQAVGAPVFCNGRPGSGACPTALQGAPDLTALQELGVFYREVVGRSAFEAGNFVADAFFRPYSAAGTPRVGAALEEKRQYLFKALKSFDQARAAMFSPVATDVVYAFPAQAFAKTGEEWVRQMRDLLGERLDALSEVIDLERRLSGAASEQAFLVAQHGLHLDYLQHVLVAAVESKWENEAYQASGSAERLFRDGATMLAQLDESKNPLGLTPNRVYFLSDQKTVRNWQFLHQQLQRELTDRTDPGTLVSLVDEAQASMQESIESSQQLTQTIHNSVQGFEQELDRLCGPVETLPPECGGPVFCEEDTDCLEYAAEGAETRCALGQCTNVDHAAMKFGNVECRGPTCDLEYKCENESCKGVKQTFKSDVGTSLSCRADTFTLHVPGADGTNRTCMRGELGSLMQERKLLELRRKQLMGDFKETLRKIETQENYIHEVRRLNDRTANVIRERHRRITILDSTMFAADIAYENALMAGEAVDCLTIAGAASGSDCAQKGIKAGMHLAANSVRAAALEGAEKSKAEISRIADEKLADIVEDKELMPLYKELDSLVASVRNHVNDYETLIQQLFNLDARIADTHYVAQRTAQRYQQQLEQQLDFFTELTGWKGNALLRRNSAVVSANKRFQRDLVLAYELVQAIRYELSFDYVHNNLTPQIVFQAVTIQDLQRLLTWVNDTMASECLVFQTAGIGECSSKQNDRFYTLSMQKALFPELTAIIDPDTGKMLTVGSQFHRLITSSQFRKKRLVNGQLISQIELPFGTWLGDLEAMRWQDGPANETPLQCDMLLQPEGVAVQVVGSLGFDVLAYLIRGGTDVQRSCSKHNNVRPIEQFSVGWIPGAADVAAEFESSAVFQNTVTDTSHLSWRTAFSDRTLSTPNYVLVLPLLDENARKLVDPPLTGTPPQIADIRIHFKYRAVNATN
jgi:hypothetical protein